MSNKSTNPHKTKTQSTKAAASGESLAEQENRTLEFARLYDKLQPGYQDTMAAAVMMATEGVPHDVIERVSNRLADLWRDRTKSGASSEPGESGEQGEQDKQDDTPTPNRHTPSEPPCVNTRFVDMLYMHSIQTLGDWAKDNAPEEVHDLLFGIDGMILYLREFAESGGMVSADLNDSIMDTTRDTINAIAKLGGHFQME